MCYSCLARSHYVISYIVTRRSLGKDPARCLELTPTRKKKGNLSKCKIYSALLFYVTYQGRVSITRHRSDSAIHKLAKF